MNNWFIILMTLAETERLIGILSGVFGILLTAIGFGIKLWRITKERNLVKWENFFKEQAEIFVILAEDIKNFEGKDKKEWVLTKINQAAIDAKIPFNAALVDTIIEKVVEITKKVNRRNKDKKEEELK